MNIEENQLNNPTNPEIERFNEEVGKIRQNGKGDCRPTKVLTFYFRAIQWWSCVVGGCSRNCKNTDGENACKNLSINFSRIQYP